MADPRVGQLVWHRVVGWPLERALDGNVTPWDTLTHRECLAVGGRWSLPLRSESDGIHGNPERNCGWVGSYKYSCHSVFSVLDCCFAFFRQASGRKGFALKIRITILSISKRSTCVDSFYSIKQEPERWLVGSPSFAIRFCARGDIFD